METATLTALLYPTDSPRLRVSPEQPLAEPIKSNREHISVMDFLRERQS
jgi:hypothetical protein